MKTKKYIPIIIIALSVLSCDNNNTKVNQVVSSKVVNGMTSSTFKVWGNCDMCKETIEGSLKIDGITKVNWDTESKMITVNYDTTKINLDQIQKSIANVGYDNPKYKGDDHAYSELPECCQYDRK